MDASEHPVRAYRRSFDPPMSLEDLAARVGTTKPNLSRIETRKQNVSADLLPKLVAETGIPAAKLRPDLAKLFNVKAAARPRAKKRARTAA